MVDSVFKRLALMSRFGEFASAEAQATAIAPYAEGLLEGALQSDPAMRAAFGAEFKARLCGSAPTTDAEIISLSQMMRIVPDQATPEAFDCFFSHAKEDVPLWSMMDAWRTTGLDKTPALTKLEATATDSRTQRRLLTPEEEARGRVALQRRLQ